MPITQETFEELPKVSATARKKGGKKCDWSKVLAHLKGQGWLVREVHEFANANCVGSGQTISRVRTKRWLDKLVEKRLAQLRQDENAFVYFVK